jgi:hypothetical protein
MKHFITLIFLAALIGGAYYYYLSFVRPLDRETIQKEFIADIPTIFRTPGGNLELAAFKATETMMSSDTARLPFFNWKIPGATTTVIINVPVIYRYHVQVLDQWDIQVVDNTCLIYAPELRPTLPPAIQTDQMEIHTFEGPLAWDDETQQAKLLQSLTPQLEANAQDSTKLKLVREEARKTVAEFVRAWLLERGEWGERKIDDIKVVFRGEGDLTPVSLTPAAELKE